MLHNPSCWSNVIRMTKPMRMRWALNVAWEEEKRNSHRLLFRKPE
jgi:hypothetical protein